MPTKTDTGTGRAFLRRLQESHASGDVAHVKRNIARLRALVSQHAEGLLTAAVVYREAQDLLDLYDDPGGEGQRT